MSGFAIGDVVRLKSGGPAMTVTHIGERGGISCTWFPDIDVAPINNIFVAAALVATEMDSADD